MDEFEGYRKPVVRRVVTKVQREPSLADLRKKVCDDNKIQWDPSLVALSEQDFQAYIQRRLVQRAKWGKR